MEWSRLLVSVEFPDSTRLALLGQSCGDAFGAPFEYHAEAVKFVGQSFKEQRYLSSIEDCGSSPKRARTPGLYTDDTQQALLLLWIWQQMALKEKDPRDGKVVGGVFLRLCTQMAGVGVQERSPGFGLHRGTGRNFREAVLKQTPPDTAGLGAAMRVAPVATLLAPDEILTWVVDVSSSTTRNWTAIAAAAMIGVEALNLSRGVRFSKQDLRFEEQSAEFQAAWLQLEEALAVLSAKGEQALLEMAQPFSSKPLKEAANGFALTGIPWVLHSVSTGTSFEDVLRKVTASGGDTDTVAAMAGALAALKFGAESIPPWMTSSLVSLDIIQDPVLWHPMRSEHVHLAMDTKLFREAEEKLLLLLKEKKVKAIKPRKKKKC